MPKARALIGWLPERDGMTLLNGGKKARRNHAAHRETCRRAREAVERRPVGCDQSQALSRLPDSLTSYIRKFSAHPIGHHCLETIGPVMIVDLRAVRAAQQTIYVDEALHRVARANMNNLESIAEITLPIPRTIDIPHRFDPQQNAWRFSSPNLNLQITGHEVTEVGEGVFAFGFTVEFGYSMLRVANLDGRYILRDGYHRAYGLLARGINYAPAFVEKVASVAELQLPKNLLPAGLYLGGWPPTMRDFLDDTVSAECELPAPMVQINIQASRE